MRFKKIFDRVIMEGIHYTQNIGCPIHYDTIEDG